MKKPRAAVEIGLNAVIVAVTENRPRVLTVERADGPPALPFGPLDPEADRTLELGLRGWVRRQTGLELGYVEQLYTFADRYRDPRLRGGPRIVSVAYLALVREGVLAGAAEARWRDVYELLPWEDWREGRPGVMRTVVSALERWCDAPRDTSARAQRHERMDICFGLHGAGWDAERVLERYELLFEAGLVAEAGARGAASRALGPQMALDHRRILATALGRLRGKLKYRPLVFELLPETFTLLQLQRVVEALAGLRLHKQNFRRLVENAGLVEGTGRIETETGGRPAERHRFRREVLRERRAPGVGLPGERTRA